MLQKNYTIYTTPEYPFEQMCRLLLLKVGNDSNVVKIVFFGSPQNNEEYLSQLNSLYRCTNAHFTGIPPLISYVSQKPFIGMLNAEVSCVESAETAQFIYGENYMVIDDGISRELITGGILPPDLSAPVSVQSNAVFAQIEEILIRENFPINSIIRQWNYIEHICVCDGESQHYQDFNDSRSHFYEKTAWSSGYPAATGIGTEHGGVMVEFIALKSEGLINVALDNPLQTAAHKYSQGVLLGAVDPCFKQRSTPKFERARVLGLPEQLIVYISGTAAIRGETSLIADDITEQTHATMQNIDYLISNDNYRGESISRGYKMLRIYVKNFSHLEEVRNYMKVNYPEPIKIYICADICRDELLIEIEGIAEINFNPAVWSEREESNFNLEKEVYNTLII